VAGAAAVLFAVGATVSGCASGSGSSGSNTITWWSPNWDTPTAKQLIAEFEKANPGDKVNLVETTNDTMATKIKTALDSGSTPDVMTELVSRIPLYSTKGQLTDLTGMFDANMPKDDFNTSALGAVTTDDKTYAIPFRWDAQGVIYNKDMFAKAGIAQAPTNWSELQADAKILKDKLGVAAYAWPYGSDANTQTRWLNAYYSNGGTFDTKADGSVSFDSAASEKALQMLADGFSDGYVSKSSFESDNTAVQNLFINKQLAFYFDGVYAVDPITKAGLNIGTAMMPGPDGPGTVGTNGWAFAIPAKAKNADLAKKFVQFMSQSDNMATLTMTFPARLSAAKDPKFANPLYKPFLDQQNEDGRAVPSSPGYAQLTQTVYKAVQQVALGKASAADANKAIVQQAQNVFKAN